MTGSTKLCWCAALATVVMVSHPTTSVAQTMVPYQFIAKTYTEGLGRMPDSSGWAGAVSFFQNSSPNCSKALLKQWGRERYLGSEYKAAYGHESGTPFAANNAARVLTLYRGILNREPDSTGYYVWYNKLKNQELAFSAVVDSFYNSAEFDNLASTAICPRKSYEFGTQKAFTKVPYDTIPGVYAGGPSNIFQSTLNASSGDTFYIAPRAVVTVLSKITIPAGKTVMTYGAPSHNKYANMARFVRAGHFDEEMISLSSGSKLRNVWVDGQRGASYGGSPIQFQHNAINAWMQGGGAVLATGTTIAGCTFSNSSGYTNIRTEGYCSNFAIHSNLITAYSSCHFRCNQTDGSEIRWTDGISSACEATTIEVNELVDISDVGIVVFRAPPGKVQHSFVNNNKILLAGNSAWAGIAADPLYSEDGDYYWDFDGTIIQNNTLWSGHGHYDVGLMVGTRIIPFGQPSDIGTNADFINNTVGMVTAPAKVDIGIGISGMLNATVTGNKLSLTLVNTNDPGTCPVPGAGCASPQISTSPLVASICDGYASGSIQAPIDTLKLLTCLGRHDSEWTCGAPVECDPPGPQLIFTDTGDAVSSRITLRVVENPTRARDLMVHFRLPSHAPARIMVLDLLGRRIVEREVGQFGLGHHAIQLATDTRLAPGLYLIRLQQGEESVVQRVIVLE